MTDAVILNQRYRLEERLGAGGMAMVYRARDLTLERDVAIKILREKFSQDPAFRERFRHEAKAAANLSHPNIVTVHDFGFDEGRLFIVMEYIPGIDLKTILLQRGKFSVKETLRLMIQACAGVGYAHRAGLIHCDIKSQNFIITSDNRLKVTDFGIARALASISPDEKTDVVWGSPQYFSPEQASGYPPSPASDVYSLGIIMYEMLTAQLPFSGTTPDELARAHREDPPPHPSRINPSIPYSLEQIILKVLAKEPSLRYRTADQFGRVLVSYSKQNEQSLNGDVPQPSLQDVYKMKPDSVVSPLKNDTQTEPKSRKSLHRQYDSSFHQGNKRGSVYESNPLDIDWLTIFLAFIALITVGGLIPFWMWIYFLYK
jgi:serine/threonine protein kinase